MGTDSLQCIAYDSLHVGNYVIDSVQAQNLQPVCSGDSAQLMATVGGSLFWEGNLLNGDFVSPNVGMSTFVVHGTDLNGCASIDTVSLEVYPLPNVYAGNDTIVCVGSQTSLQAVGAINYQWSNLLPNGSSMNVLQNLNLTVTGVDFHGCSNFDSLHIGIDSIPSLNFAYGPASGCAPLAVSLNNQSSGNVFTNVLWNFSNGAFLIGDSIHTLFHEVGCFDVSMQVTTPLGCQYSTSQANAICTFPVPTSSFNIPNQNLTTVYNGVTLENMSSGGSVYTWDFGDGSPVNSQENPYHAFPVNESNSYEVMLVTTNEYGCTDTSYQIIEIHEELTYYVPNAFTPDGNQFNNVWKPVFTEGLDPQNYHVSIFNRWGEIVWESYNSNVGWDGTYGTNGLPVQDGVYIYNICFGYKDSAKKENITGHIAMIR
jgi:gliding motility-associated-like protein